jgi:hypothetical protein
MTFWRGAACMSSPASVLTPFARTSTEVLRRRHGGKRRPSGLRAEGDVRVLANVRSDEYWADTMLHELGHATYSRQESLWRVRMR